MAEPKTGPSRLQRDADFERLRQVEQQLRKQLKDANQRLEAAEKLRVDIAPLSGVKVQELVAKLYATPKDIVARARAAIRP